MIVDDAYIIVGSANINQRSMAGTRDTEMAVGCWQPSFPESHPFGEVHMFRRALWATHFMSTDNVLLYPGSIECVNQVKKMAYDNWQQYSRFVPSFMKGSGLNLGNSLFLAAVHQGPRQTGRCSVTL